MGATGVYKATKKDGTCYYRSSITYKGKHISLGSYPTENLANTIYLTASQLLQSNTPFEQAIFQDSLLPFERMVSLLNYRDNGIYIKNPIYLHHNYFYYYLDTTTPLKFDIDDLFYYSNHKIQKRGNYLFVADYGMQINILSRYGIKNYSVPGKDYRHANQNEYDFTYDNMEVINPYYGVSSIIKKGKTVYKARIHLNGNYLIGYYSTAEEAAVAYNKAVDLVMQKGCHRSFQTNYILSLSASAYAELYHSTPISSKLQDWRP